jgi:hypothetical protein
MVIPWHVHPSAPYDGRRDLALEERARQRLFESRCASMVQREHVRMFGVDQYEHGLAGHHGQAFEHAVCDDKYVTPPLFFVFDGSLTTDNHLKVVLTTVWCELMADPRLFSGRRVASRDLKVIAVSALFVGGFCSRAILQAIGSPASLGIGTGIRVLIALSWFFVPGKRAAAPKKS